MNIFRVNRVRFWTGLVVLLVGSVALGDTFYDADWSGLSSGKFNKTDGSIVPGELVLKNDVTDFVSVLDVTGAVNPYAVTIPAYRGDLYIGATPVPIAQDGGDVMRYNYATHTHELIGQVFEQGIIEMRTLGDTLYIPGLDSQGSWAFANVYLYDGVDFVRKETIPSSNHLYQITKVENKLYIIGSQVRDEIGDRAVWESSDNGGTSSLLF